MSRIFVHPCPPPILFPYLERPSFILTQNMHILVSHTNVNTSDNFSKKQNEHTSRYIYEVLASTAKSWTEFWASLRLMIITGLEYWRSVPGRRIKRLVHYRVHISCGMHLVSYWYRGLTATDIKVQECETLQSPSTSAQIKNVWSYISTSSYTLIT